MNNINQNTYCLACGSTDIKLALDLGDQPLANSYKDTVEDDQTWPLAVNVCNNCHHTQLTHTVNPEIIYKNYMYLTGTNNTIKLYCEWFANFCAEYISSDAKSVLDIGCNDGTQLNYFKQIGFDTYGIDPAENIYANRNHDHNVVCGFFGKSTVSELKKNSYSIISAQNVFAHNPNPVDFLTSCYELMNDDTVLFIQTSQADMILNNEFDTIYHEHVNFFNAKSMQECALRSNLYLIDVVKTPIHGTSYIFVLSKKPSNQYRIKNILALEEADGLQNQQTYIEWSNIVHDTLRDFSAEIEKYRTLGYVLVGYGAAAKGMTLLNASKVKLDFIIDDNPLKQGKYTPGTNTLIVSADLLESYTASNKLLFVPLAWNFFKEIRSRIKKIRNNSNDRFIKYFPKVTISE